MPLEAFMDKDVQADVAALTARIVELEKKCVEWERWYEGCVADFVGMTSNPSDPDKLHDWEWLDDWRPAPTHIETEMLD